MPLATPTYSVQKNSLSLLLLLGWRLCKGKRRKALSTFLLLLWSVVVSQGTEVEEKIQALGERGSIIPVKEERGCFPCPVSDVLRAFLPVLTGVRRKGKRVQVGVRVGHLQTWWSLNPCDPKMILQASLVGLDEKSPRSSWIFWGSEEPAQHSEN